MSLAEALNQARLPIIDFKTCRQKKFWGDRVRDSMICAGFRDTEGPPAACQVGPRCNAVGRSEKKILSCKFPTSSPPISLLLPLPGRFWWSPAVPAGAGPLGGARSGELRPDRLHRGEQAQRFHPHRRLHPLDRGNTHQGLLPALSGPPDSALTANISSAPFYVRGLQMTAKLFLLKVSKPQFIIHVPPTCSPFLGLTQQPLQDVNTCSECAIIVF